MTCIYDKVLIVKSLLEMSKKRKNAKILSKPIDSDINPQNAKIVLFVFSIGPIILVGMFLASNGFFS